MSALIDVRKHPVHFYSTMILRLSFKLSKLSKTCLSRHFQNHFPLSQVLSQILLGYFFLYEISILGK